MSVSCEQRNATVKRKRNESMDGLFLIFFCRHSTGGEQPRKLAFHEPRPCPICRRMYRDAATLRTHTAIMHAEGRDPFACLCGELFRTKYEMYMHKKNGHR